VVKQYLCKLLLNLNPRSVATAPNPRLGVALTVLGIALFSLLNGAVKELAEVFPTNQIIFFRNVFALPPLLALVFLRGGMPLLRIGRPGLQIILAVVFTVSLFLAFEAFAMMPLADATAIRFSQPLIVIVLAGLWGREKPLPAEWVAVIFGMFGIAIMVEPTGQGNGLGVAFALGGAALAALSMIFQRDLSSHVASLSITFYMLLISSLLITPTLAVSWVQPTFSQGAWLIGMGITSGIAQYLMVRAFYHARASVIAPISYSGMLWAIIIGFVWFGDVPTLRVMLGTGFILLTTAFTFRIASNTVKRSAVNPPN
jgi:drug/metabolite transporter (DMT)-like permease